MPVQSIDRALDIVEALSVQPHGMLLKDLSAEVGLHVSTTHRLLASLVSRGYVQKDIETGKYRLTVRLFEIGSRAISGMNLVSISRPYLEQLAAGTGETVHLVARNNDEVVYLYKEDRRESVIHMASFVGLRSPMYRTAVGKSILALLPEEEVRRIWDRSVIEPLTPNTIVRYDDLLENLAIVRQRGWAMDNEENELGVLCIAAPIKDFTNTPIGAISISAPAARMTFSTCERFALKVIASTNAISRALGAPVTVSPV
jgi:DNA-binding IclR family transcriptional regulator